MSSDENLPAAKSGEPDVSETPTTESSTGGEPDAEARVPKTTGAETTGAETTGAETTGAETTGAETTGAETTGAETAAPDTPEPEPTTPEVPVVDAVPEAPALDAVPEAPALDAVPEAPALDAVPEAPALDAVPEAPALDAVPEAPALDASPTPRPVPRPSPAVLAGTVRPAAPAATVAPAPAPAAAEAPEPPSDSTRFGRVDDDGTVHVALPDGTEATVGQWAAGTPAEGLAFFVRKYDDLSVEVDLATRRLREGKAAPEQAAAVVKRVREALASPSMVGDLASLGERVEQLDSLVAERRKVVSEQRAAAKAAALAAREAIVAEAEQLAESTQWKATGERFKTLLEDWKTAPRADRAGEQSLWKRFSHARSQFDKHRRQYFAKLDGERGEAKQVKEALVAEAESLSDSTDWGATAGAYRDLMTRWKAAGRAGKVDEEALWERFRAAQDSFFAARSAAFGERDAGFAENLAAKEALLTEAEAIDTSDLTSAKAALRGIQERWEQVGHVPRGDKERVESRLRRVEEAVRKGEQDQWKRTNPEGKARAEATVAQFQGSLDKLEKERAKAEAAGDARKVADAESRIATTRSLLDAAQRAATEFGG